MKFTHAYDLLKADAILRNDKLPHILHKMIDGVRYWTNPNVPEIGGVWVAHRQFTDYELAANWEVVEIEKPKYRKFRY